MNIEDAVNANIKVADGKVKSSWWRLLMLGVAAGIFIGLGAAVSSMAAHGLPTTGLVRLVTGLIFPLGLCLVILLCAELFTGNVLMINALISRKIGWHGLLKNWGWVFLGNFIGSVGLAALIVYFGQIDVAGEALAIHSAKVAAFKVGLPWMNAFVLAVFCNILVCAAVYMAIMAKSVAGKIVAIWVPIAAFVIAGFEHSVANMYYIPVGIFAYLNPTYSDAIVTAGINVANLDFGLFIVNNLVPVTLGNVVGGALIGLMLYCAHCKKHGKTKTLLARLKK